MSENGILEAEQRVREMNRLTQQYSEQGNRYLQNMRNSQNVRQTRFEPAEPYSQQKSGQDNFSGNRIGGQAQQIQQRQTQPQFQQGHDQQRQNRFRQSQPQNRPQNFQQNWQRQNFRDPQNNSCPPHGDPAGERRNMPGTGRQGMFSHSGNSLSVPVNSVEEEHFHNEIHSNNTGSSNRSPGFPDLLADNEKLMILLLMYLLMKEKADIKLILALGYLLL